MTGARDERMPVQSNCGAGLSHGRSGRKFSKELSSSLNSHMGDNLGYLHIAGSEQLSQCNFFLLQYPLCKHFPVNLLTLEVQQFR